MIERMSCNPIACPPASHSLSLESSASLVSSCFSALGDRVLSHPGASKGTCVRDALSRFCRLVSTVRGAVGWKICKQPDVHGWVEFACHAISLKYTFQHLRLDLLMAYLVKDVGLVVFDSSSVLSNLTTLGACSPASKRKTPRHSVVIIIKRGWGGRGAVQRNRQKEFVGVGSF